MKLQKQLSFWFTVHFVFDFVSAVMIFTAPDYFLRLAGWQDVDIIAARLVSAALFGIGIESLLGRNSTLPVFRNMLRLKVIWSFFASAGIAVSLVQAAQGRAVPIFVLLAVFIAFHILWVTYLVRVQRRLRETQTDA